MGERHHVHRVAPITGLAHDIETAIGVEGSAHEPANVGDVVHDDDPCVHLNQSPKRRTAASCCYGGILDTSMIPLLSPEQQAVDTKVTSQGPKEPFPNGSEGAILGE